MKSRTSFYTYFSVSLISILLFISFVYAQPAINLIYNPGVTVSKRGSGENLDFYVQIKDWDGITSDDSSHEVTVKFPDGTIVPIPFLYQRDEYTAYYETYVAVSSSSGSYIFSVTNLRTGLSGKATDELVVRPELDVPDLSSHLPSHGTVLTNTNPTMSWAPVNGAKSYRVKIMKEDNSVTWNLWTGAPPFTVPPGLLESYSPYKYRIYAHGEPWGLEVDNKARALNPAAPEDNWDILFATGAQSQVPFIEVEPHGVYTFKDGLVATPFVVFDVDISDAQGVPGNIKTASVTTPLGEKINLYFDYSEYPTKGRYKGHLFPELLPDRSFAPLPEGTYVFQVEDKNGNAFTTSEALTASPVDFPVTSSMSPSHNAVLNDTAVTFSWDPVPGAAFYQIQLRDADYNYLYSIRTENTSYSIPAGILKENSLYRYGIEVMGEFYNDNVDNMAMWRPDSWVHHQFTTTPVTSGTNPPVIESNRFGAFTITMPYPGTDELTYRLGLEAYVSDPDGVPGNVKSVEVLFPDQKTKQVLRYERNVGTNKALYAYYDALNFDSLQHPADIWSGTFTFTATDHNGYASSFTDDLIINIVPPVSLLAPGQDSIVFTTSPTIMWDLVTGANNYMVRIYRPWGRTVFTSPYLPGDSTLYKVPAGKLATESNYSYAIYAFDSSPEFGDVDNASKHGGRQSEFVHFTVEAGTGDGSEPTLPGNNVSVQPVDTDTGLAPVTITFDEINIDGEGITSVALTSQGPATPSGFKLGDPPIFAELNTTAAFAGSIEVCFSYIGVTLDNEFTATLFHYEDTDNNEIPDTWVDITSLRDLSKKIVCGIVDTLSPFAIFEADEILVEVDIKPGSSINNIKLETAGVIPVAVLSSETFDATQLDPTTIKLSGASIKFAGRSRRYLVHDEDVNGDGFLDLVCQVETKELALEEGQTEAVLSGQTATGITIYGSDVINIVK
jgi:hypothetical protein